MERLPPADAEREPLPADPREATARIGIDLPEACVAGVEANLRLLATHLRTLRGEET